MTDDIGSAHCYRKFRLVELDAKNQQLRAHEPDGPAQSASSRNKTIMASREMNT